VSREADLPDVRTSGQIAGYRLDGCISKTDTATVYLAWDEQLDRQLALKVLAPELASETAVRATLLRESRAAAGLAHPNIIPVYEAVEAGGLLYVAMQYVPGGDAGSLLRRTGPLPVAAVWNILAQAGSALDAAHAHGLVHRDVKPANMLLEAVPGPGDGSPRPAGDLAGHAYLADFGMGPYTSPGQALTASQSIGTFHYLAPEQIEGRALDGRADLYSLACAGFELLCGTPLFDQDQGLTVMYAQLYAPPPSAAARRPDLPPAVDRVLGRALAKNPADRYTTCGQFADELSEALGLAAGPATPAQSRPPDETWPGPGAVPVFAAASSPGAPESGPETALLPVPAQSGPPRRARRPGAFKVVLAAVAAAVIAAVAITLALPKKSALDSAAGSGSAATSASGSASAQSASAQAAAVQKLLVSSAATRQGLNGAIGNVSGCTNLSTAVSDLQNAVSQRGAEYKQASALSASALPDAAAVKSGLITALHMSLEADQDYLTWAQQQQSSGCASPAQSSAYSAAYRADQQADTAKEAFVQVWNPVAAKYGVKQTSAGDF
jgi:serine/threonine protein kinase